MLKISAVLCPPVNNAKAARKTRKATVRAIGDRASAPERTSGPPLTSIASAVRCFAWGEADALVDTNTTRVVGRVFGLDVKESSRRNRLFITLIQALVDPEDARSYNYALLDLAADICTKSRPPDCPRCPVRRWCSYGTARLEQAPDLAA